MGKIKFVEDKDRIVDWEKEWEIMVLFLEEKNLISEYKEYRQDFLEEEEKL